ncbi:hypothetical protein NL676_036763 [Syzygium grande]|nr:hypothetical protein NL676_036763 [Syzygium grande]
METELRKSFLGRQRARERCAYHRADITCQLTSICRGQSGGLFVKLFEIRVPNFLKLKANCFYNQLHRLGNLYE